MGDNLEREVKMAAPPGFHLPPLDQVLPGVSAGPLEAVRMETVYWDTPDLRLARWGCSLRHRQREGWTLKLEAGTAGAALVRRELTFAGDGRRPPAAAAGLVRAYVRGSALGPVARLSTLRQRLTLRGERAAKLAEVVDDEVSVLEGRRVAGRFRELEVELAPAAGADLEQALLGALRAAGAGAPDTVAKHVRALGPRATEPPEVAPAPIGPDATAGDVVRAALAASVALLMRHDPGVRLGGHPEHVHQARVGSRRLRSHLKTFASLLDADWAATMETELRWLGSAFGEVRDSEVLAERLRGRSIPAADSRPLENLLGRLEADTERARVRLLEDLSSTRYIELLDLLVAAANQPPLVAEAGEPAAVVIPRLAAKAWRRLRAVAAVAPEAAEDAVLHRVRIRAKACRYAAEAATGIAPEAAEFAKAVARLQSVLGEHQDSVAARAWLRRAAGAGRQGFVAGQLHAFEVTAAEAARREWPADWKAARRKRLRGWLA